MATLATNRFTSYTLTEGEALSGQVLNLSQKFVLQNRLSEIAQQKLALQYTPENSLNFLQQEAFWTGQIALLSSLLEESDAAEVSLRSNQAI